MLARPGPLDLETLRTPPYREGLVAQRIELQAGVFLAALRTPTLPPATHTNTWLLQDGGGLALVDPGASDPAEQARLFRLLDGLAAEGVTPRAVWLTHAHPDHVGAVGAVVDRYRVPVFAHPLASRRLKLKVEPLLEGDRLGRYRVLETPGHAPEHLCFLDEHTGALFCGDMLSTLSTIVIDPPEGDMAEFVRQLGRLADLGPRTLFPGHGPPALGGADLLREAIAHRAAREAQIVAALAEPGTLEDVTARAYADTPTAIQSAAVRSCLATLLKLQSEGRTYERGGVWFKV